jgi:hypothetical protein
MTRVCWETRFEELLTYKKDHEGSCRVPAHRDKLGRWVERQRSMHRLGKLDPDKIERLESIGFEWKLQYRREPRNAVSTEDFDESFNIMLKRVVAFVERKGHCRNPQHYKEDPELGHWVKNRRSEKSRGTLLKEREERLNDVGFVWYGN